MFITISIKNQLANSIKQRVIVKFYWLHFRLQHSGHTFNVILKYYCTLLEFSMLLPDKKMLNMSRLYWLSQHGRLAC